jgi:hypothetical protein
MALVINKIPLSEEHYSSLINPEDYFPSFSNDLMLEKLEDKNKLLDNAPDRDQIFPSRDSKKRKVSSPPKKEKNKEPEEKHEEKKDEKPQQDEVEHERKEEKEPEEKGEIDEMLDKINFSDLEDDFRVDKKPRKDSRSPSRSVSRSRSKTKSKRKSPSRSRSPSRKSRSRSRKKSRSPSRSSSRSHSRSSRSRSSRSRSRSRSPKKEKGKEEELDDDDDYTLKLKNLKKYCQKNNINIEIPDVTEFTPLDKKKSMYKMAMKELSFSQKEKRQRLFLKACFALTELLYKAVGFKNIEGFAEAQMEEMESYSKLMMELGERDYMNFGKKFPVEVRLGALILFNSVIFCIFGKTMSKAKKEEKKKGGSSPFGMMKMFMRMAGFGGKKEQPQPYEGKKMKGPSFSME